MKKSIPVLSTFCGLTLMGLASIANFAQAQNIEAGKEIYSQRGCAACHGTEGVAQIPTYPSLAGQNAPYLEQSLKNFQAGVRNNAIMMPMAVGLDEQNIKDIAAYLASLK